MERKSLAARAGSWSARHKKTAIFGWIAFVIAAFAIGNAVGMKQLEDADKGSGDSRAAERVIEDKFVQTADEQVLVQAKDGNVLRAAVKDVKQAAGKFDYVKLGQDDVSADGRSVLVNFEIPGADDEKTEEQVVP